MYTIVLNRHLADTLPTFYQVSVDSLLTVGGKISHKTVNDSGLTVRGLLANSWLTMSLENKNKKAKVNYER